MICPALSLETPMIGTVTLAAGGCGEPGEVGDPEPHAAASTVNTPVITAAKRLFAIPPSLFPFPFSIAAGRLFSAAWVSGESQLEVPLHVRPFGGEDAVHH